MPHAEVTKAVPYEFEVLHATDKSGVPVAVPVTKATFAIVGNKLVLAEKQQPISLAGLPYGKPGESSYRYEPEYAYFKPNTDVILIANAICPEGAGVQTTVEFSAGPLRQSALVFGDRFWYRGFLGPSLSGPEPFSSMPLIYERAFGGWDRHHTDPSQHIPFRPNPVGVGFQPDFTPGTDQLPLPNVENPADLVSSLNSRPAPVGFGFTSPDWMPRAVLAGTFDKSWEADRAPLLPLDFNERFFNAGSAGLVASGYFQGNETVRAVNCTATPIQFNLPGVSPPVCRLLLSGQKDVELRSKLDTIVVDLLENIVTLTWRCYAPLPRGPHQLLEVHVGSQS